MANSGKRERTITMEWLAGLVVWGGFGLSILALAGCTSMTPMTNNAQPKADPLLGVPPAPATPTQANPTQPTAYERSGVPVIPALHSPTNNATLASFSGQAIGNSLAINDTTRNAPGEFMNRSKLGPNAEYLPPNPNPKVEPVPDANPLLGQPETRTSAWQSGASAPQAAIPSATAAATEETFWKALQARGAINQKRESTSEGLRLTCYVAVGATGLRTYTVTAATYAAAAQAILDQIDQVNRK